MSNNLHSHLNLHLYKPKSKLALCDSLSDELLSDFTDNDIADWEREYDQKLVLKRSDDIGTTQTVIADAQSALTFLFGEDSKQLKYINRALQKGETVSDVHYNKFINPKDAKAQIESAKIKCGTHSASVGLNQTNVDDLNEAIDFLIGKGYIFGRDFNAHNAIAVAKASYLETCMDNNENVKLDSTVEECEGCEKEFDDSSVDVTQMTLSCGCYQENPLEISFSDGTPMFVKAN